MKWCVSALVVVVSVATESLDNSNWTLAARTVRPTRSPIKSHFSFEPKAERDDDKTAATAIDVSGVVIYTIPAAVSLHICLKSERR